MSLAMGVSCAIFIAGDEFGHPQKMGVMNIVWPVTALFGSFVWLWAYWRYGRPRADAPAPKAVQIGKATSHCGAGCTLGDIAAECLVLLVPALPLWFGWKSLFTQRIFAVWTVDFVCAYIIGIVFQYFAIVPMRKLDFPRGIWESIKADTLSLIAWQLGMYAFMAFAQFYLFRFLLGTELKAAMPEFWFMMQIAMLAG
ncbi:MAG TPA: DUF4396 domain-containing protein, partial [Rhizomicrobium sp.]|nr:DUF4396 domain-containing protein [Rhizomicrobium sp.]